MTQPDNMTRDEYHQARFDDWEERMDEWVRERDEDEENDTETIDD